MRQSKQVIEIIKRAHTLSINKGIYRVGSEYLLYSMIEEKDSTFCFLLREYQIDEQELIDQIENLFIIRKFDYGKEEKTSVFQKIINDAEKYAIHYNANEVEDEHLLLSILENKSIARTLLIDQHLDIEEIKNDIADIYNYDEEEPLVTNITRMVENGRTNPFIGRNEYLERLDVILNRKGKSNPLLIGEAGVGKTAIVEGLAKYYLGSGKEILSLDVGLSLAGTKYRGDFEKRILDAIKKIENNDQYILFIDEIHNIVGAGSSEGSMDAANLLKPILARGQIKCIGATTVEEYHKYIVKDKALARRFQPIFIDEPSIGETITILKGIRKAYEQHHQVCITDELLEYLAYESNERIINRKFPDKAIDVLDETLSKAKIYHQKQIDYYAIDEAIDLIMGVKNSRAFLNMRHQELQIYALYKYRHVKRKTLVSIGVDNGDIEPLIEDILMGFDMGKERVLEIDLSYYNDSFAFTSLIGAPTGYVGYENGGIFSEHLIKFPTSLVVLKNFDVAKDALREFFINAVLEGQIRDRKGRNISLNNTVMLFVGKEQQGEIGFFKTTKKEKYLDVYVKIKPKEYDVLGHRKIHQRDENQDFTNILQSMLENKA